MIISKAIGYNAPKQGAAADGCHDLRKIVPGHSDVVKDRIKVRRLAAFGPNYFGGMIKPWRDVSRGW